MTRKKYWIRFEIFHKRLKIRHWSAIVLRCCSMPLDRFAREINNCWIQACAKVLISSKQNVLQHIDVIVQLSSTLL